MAGLRPIEALDNHAARPRLRPLAICTLDRLDAGLLSAVAAGGYLRSTPAAEIVPSGVSTCINDGRVANCLRKQDPLPIGRVWVLSHA